MNVAHSTLHFFGLLYSVAHSPSIKRNCCAFSKTILATSVVTIFYRIADQLKKLKILGETDVDALARYITANDFYVNAVKKMRSKEVKDDPYKFETWAKIQERYFKQCRASANDLGLSISSRCKLVVPETKKETPKENKFKKFEKRPAVNG